MAATRAISLLRGSMMTSFTPRATASWRCLPGFMQGMPIDFEIVGLAPTNIQTSAESKSRSPPPQLPWSAGAIILPGWSIVALVKSIGEPMAASQAWASGVEAG